MKIICSKENLLKGMNIVLRAVPSRTTMDILKCVLLQAEDDRLRLTANDTSLGIETNIPAIISEPGSAAIEASLFSSIVRKLPDSDIILETDENEAMKISCDNVRFNIAGRGTDDFVYLPSIDVENSIIISQYTLREMIGQVIFSISDSDLNAAMSGVYMEVLGEKLRMTTLDGHRISVRVSPLRDDYTPVKAIIPGKAMNDISRIITGNHDDDMEISFSSNHIMFEFDETRVVLRLIDGDYFNVSSMLREEHETHFRISNRILLDCLDRSTLLINENDKKPVIMTISDEVMNLRLRSAIGTMDENIPVQKEGKDIKIAFNPKLLMDALRVIDDETIDIYMVKYNYPCTIRNDEGTYSYVVLPVNFTEE